MNGALFCPNAAGPPRKKRADAVLRASAEKLLQLPQNNCRTVIPQHVYGTAITWHRWEIEAGRLFAEFWRTANARHLQAFASHVRAMRALAGRRVS